MIAEDVHALMTPGPGWTAVAAAIARKPTWMRSAACTGATEVMFAADDRATGPAVDAAKAVCGGCAVRAECLAHALATRERHGVWGGLTSRERALERRRSA